ncbi:endocuticle structural glycoprotein SgAbd-2-like [Pollicipes pollicipes]|uniref:endocuticle structural glycoprotein SgAbd-2-like n=1 Tax=Pollicipes pollicipes TaxID=41117 RepID=UPI001884A1CE|nr:endocuticle structural glycoprotein SgAbd-2-like [Pollicipes pollicipes]
MKMPRTSYGAAPAVRTVAAPLPLVRILESTSTSDDQGGYAFRFLSEDDIQRQEEAADGTVFGSYSYISPEGVPVSVRYVADTLGFRAESDALPTPPAVEYEPVYEYRPVSQ